MGSSLNKDQNVQVFMTLTKGMYYAGQAVEGTVHINCLNDRPYRYLNITIQGKEQCFWTQKRGEYTETYINSRDTYRVQINLAKFNLGIQRGHYNFPFSILLPRAFPANFKLDGLNYIRYDIAAVIPPYDQNSSAQAFKRSLHIRQPPRGVPLQLKSENICTSQCCGCCCNCGSVYLTMQADINHVQCDKIFHVRGSINNQNGQINIKNYKIVLRERVKKISHFEFSHVEHDDLLLYDANKPVPKGMSESFQCEIGIPPQFTGYTAIGSIIYRTYFLALVAEVSCCISNPSLEIHTVVLNPKLPALQADQHRDPPVGWYPVTAAPLAFVNIQPYLYTPSGLVDVRNQDGQIAGPMMYEMPLGTNQALYPQ